MAASWYNDAWPYRLPISVYVLSSETATSIDLVLDADLPGFWDNVASETGDDILLTEADGLTLIDNSLASAFDLGGSFSKASKTGSIRLDTYGGFAAGADNRAYKIWMYYGNAAGTNYEFGAWSSPSIILPNGTVIRKESPLSRPRYVYRAEDPNVSEPRDIITKTTDENKSLWFDFRRILFRRNVEHEGKLWLEGVDYAVWEITDGGTPVGVVGVPKHLGNGVVSCNIPAQGISGDKYLGVCKIRTTEANTYEQRVLIQLNDPDDP